MKISELKGKKIVHICVILGIIVLILIIAGIIMLRYQVEGETNLPFELTKMIVVSTAERMAEGNGICEKRAKDRERQRNTVSFGFHRESFLYHTFA